MNSELRETFPGDIFSLEQTWLLITIVDVTMALYYSIMLVLHNIIHVYTIEDVKRMFKKWLYHTPPDSTGFHHSHPSLQRATGQCHCVEQYCTGTASSHLDVHARLLLDPLRCHQWDDGGLGTTYIVSPQSSILCRKNVIHNLCLNTGAHLHHIERE